MKALTNLALAVALTSGAVAAQAADRADRDLADCMAQLRGIYGEQTELNLVDRRRVPDGTRLRVAARLDADNSYFANCWVASYDAGDDGYPASATALVAVEPGENNRPEQAGDVHP